MTVVHTYFYAYVFLPMYAASITNTLAVQHLSPMLLLNECRTTFPRPTQRMLKFIVCHSCFTELFGSDLKRKANVGFILSSSK